jgi:hypothetical protein
MKLQLYFVLTVCLFNFSALKAQDSLHVTEAPMLMTKGTQNGYTVIIPQAKAKDIISTWKKYSKQGESKSSIEEVEGEYKTSGTTMVNISPSPMTVYVQIKDMEKSVRLTAYFSEDDSNFISTASSPEKGKAAENYVRNYAQAQYRLAVERELGTENKKLADLEEQKEDLLKANEKSEKLISENERKTDHAKTEIEANTAAQGRRRSEVAGQKEVVRVTTPKTETYDLEEKKLNNLEKELKKLERDNESMHDDIEGWKSDNNQQKRNIEKNEDLIKEKKNAIDKQKDHVKEIQAKLERMK